MFIAFNGLNAPFPLDTVHAESTVQSSNEGLSRPYLINVDL